MSNIKSKDSTPYDFMVKLLILGDSAVGKSAIMSQFCEKNFSLSHIATIGVDFKYKTIECDGSRVKLQIWDTAGQEKFRSVVHAYYKGAMGIVLMYSVNDRKSFQNIESWMKQIFNNAATGIIVVLVGNKCDLPDRVVETSEGKRVAESYNIKFFETSAKDGTNVNEVFYELAKEIKSRVSEDPTILNEKNVTPIPQAPGVIKLDTSQHRGQDLTQPRANPNENGGGCKC